MISKMRHFQLFLSFKLIEIRMNQPKLTLFNQKGKTSLKKEKSTFSNTSLSCNPSTHSPYSIVFERRFTESAPFFRGAENFSKIWEKNLKKNFAKKENFREKCRTRRRRWRMCLRRIKRRLWRHRRQRNAVSRFWGFWNFLKSWIFRIFCEV